MKVERKLECARNVIPPLPGSRKFVAAPHILAISRARFGSKSGSHFGDQKNRISIKKEDPFIYGFENIPQVYFYSIKITSIFFTPADFKFF